MLYSVELANHFFRDCDCKGTVIFDTNKHFCLFFSYNPDFSKKTTTFVAMETISIQEFEQQFKQLYRPLCLFALRYTDQEEDVEDIVQQAFADVWEKRQAGEPILHLKSYLYQTVKNRTLSLLESVGLHPKTDQIPELADTSDEERVRQAEQDDRLWRAIDRLPPMRKQILLLAKRDGLKQQEIADLLQISIKTVEAQLNKAIKTLKETVVRIYLFFFS